MTGKPKGPAKERLTPPPLKAFILTRCQFEYWLFWRVEEEVLRLTQRWLFTCWIVEYFLVATHRGADFWSGTGYTVWQSCGSHIFRVSRISDSCAAKRLLGKRLVYSSPRSDCGLVYVNYASRKRDLSSPSNQRIIPQLRLPEPTMSASPGFRNPLHVMLLALQSPYL